VSKEKQRAMDLTTAENVTLDVWLDSELDGEEHLADRQLDAGLDVEHFIAVIPLDPRLITDEQRTELKQLIEQARSLGVDMPPFRNLTEPTGDGLPIIVHPDGTRAAAPAVGGSTPEVSRLQRLAAKRRARGG
jgi:hypothetical protein